MTSYQAQIAGDFNVVDRQTVRGPRTLGKTGLAAILINLFGLLYDGEDWKAPTTASHWRQLEKFLWPEVHKWAKKIKWDKVGRDPYDPRLELQGRTLKLHTGQAFAMASDNSETMEGAHADYIFIVFDESKLISAETFDRMEGTIAGGGIMTKWLSISTPGAPMGRFYELHKRRDVFDNWRAVHVTREDAIAAGRMDKEWAERMFRQWGEQSALYQNHVLGEFAATDEDGIIPLAWVELAMERGDQWRDRGIMGELTSVGVDMGTGTPGNDDSTIAKVYDNIHVADLEVEKFYNPDTAMMQMAGKIKGIIDAYGVYVFLDTIGIGLGTYHRLIEQGIKKVVAFVASRKVPPSLKDRTKQYKFANLRAAAWWAFRERLDPESKGAISLPRNDLLIGELTAPKFVIKSDAVLQVESKQDLRKRLGRSTDHADPVIQAVVGPEIARPAKTSVYVVGQGEL